MNYKYLLLCAIQSQLIWTAATSQPVKTGKAKQAIPKYIKLIPEDHLSAGKLQLKIPLSSTEPITGKTFKQLTEETIEKGLPLVLAHFLYVSSDGKFDRKVLDGRALIRAYATWDNTFLRPGRQIIDMKAIDKIIEPSMQGYLDKTRKPCHLCLIGSTNTIYSLYKPMGRSTMRIICSDSSGSIKLENASFSSLALLYEFTKDVRILRALDTMYQGLSQHQEATKAMCLACQDGQKRLRASFPIEWASSSYYSEEEDVSNDY